MNSKLILAVGIVSAAAMIISACNQKTPAADQEEATPKVDYTQEKAELVFYSWGNAPEASFNQTYGDPIRKKFPNYTVRYIQRGNKSVQDVISSGEKIDIYFDSIGNFGFTSILNGLQFDMTELIKKHKVDLTVFEPTTVEAMSQMSNGGMFGVPLSNTSRVMYFNKAIFNRFGVQYPRDGMTWDEVFELAKKITRVDGGTQFLGLGTTLAHPIRMNSLSLPLTDAKTGKSAINNDNWKKVFETAYLKPFEGVTDPNVLKAKSFPSCFGPFTNAQSLAMCVDLSSNPTVQFESMSKVDWDMVSIPTYKELPGVGAQLYPTYLSITSLSDNRDAAMEAIKYLTSLEYQVTSSKQGVMSALQDTSVRQVLGSESMFKDKNWKSVYFNKPAPIPFKSVYDYDLEKIVADTGKIMELVRGEVDQNSFFRLAEERANAFLKEKGVLK